MEENEEKRWLVSEESLTHFIKKKRIVDVSNTNWSMTIYTLLFICALCIVASIGLIFVILLKPKIVKTGGDMHYASTLKNHTDKDGKLIVNNQILENVTVVDSSSSRNLPTPNPTYYFVSRAIRLIRKFKA